MSLLTISMIHISLIHYGAILRIDWNITMYIYCASAIWANSLVADLTFTSWTSQSISSLLL